MMLLTTFLMAAALIQPGDLMPSIQGEDLTGKKAQLPAAARGKVTLVAMGFTYSSRYAVEDWVKRYRAEYGKDPSANFFEVPIIGGMARMGKWFIDSGMRKGTAREDHNNVITVYGSSGDWKKMMGFAKDDDAYLLLLDSEGRVQWKHAGKFDEAEWKVLSAKIRDLLKATN